jgi:hypothetical protein
MSSEPQSALVPLASLCPDEAKRKSRDVMSVMVPSDLLSRPSLSCPIRHPLPVSLDFADDWVTDFWDSHDASQKPMRCFSCSRVLSHRYTPYTIEVHERRHDVDEVLALLGI